MRIQDDGCLAWEKVRRWDGWEPYGQMQVIVRILTFTLGGGFTRAYYVKTKTVTQVANQQARQPWLLCGQWVEGGKSRSRVTSQEAKEQCRGKGVLCTQMMAGVLESNGIRIHLGGKGGLALMQEVRHILFHKATII